MNISIFEFLEKTDDKNFFIKYSPFHSYLKQLAEKYNEFLEKDNEKEYSFFMIKENSKPDFVIIRFLILIKKYFGEKSVLEIYKNLTKEIILIRDFLIKNKIDEEKTTKSFIDALKKQKNFSLLNSGKFKVEDVLYSKLEKEIKNENSEEKRTEEKIQTEINKKDRVKKGYEIKNSELIVYSKEGKILKRIPAFLTESNDIKPFIIPYTKYREKYYYLGKYSFGKNIKLSNLNTETKDILLKLIKKLKEKNDDIN